MRKGQHGGRRRKTKKWSHFRPFLANIAALLCAVIGFCVIWMARADQGMTDIRLRLQDMRSDIDLALQNAIANSQILRASAERELMRDSREETHRELALLMPDGDGFVTGSPPESSNAPQSCLLGNQEIPEFHSARAREMASALALAPLMTEVQKIMPGVGWVYYASLQGFASLSSVNAHFPCQTPWRDKFIDRLYFEQMGPRLNPEHAVRWLNVRLDPTGQRVITSLAAPVYDADGKYRAFVATDFPLETLKRFLNLPEPALGHYYIVNQEDQVLLTSQEIHAAREVQYLRDLLPETLKSMAHVAFPRQRDRCLYADKWQVCNEYMQGAPWRLLYVANDWDIHIYHLFRMKFEMTGFALMLLLLVALEMRRRFTQSMRERNGRYLHIIESAEQGFWIWNLETREFFANPYFDALTGYAHGESPLRQPNWSKHVADEDARRIRASLRSYLHSHKPYHQIEFQMRAKAGGWRSLLSRCRVVERDERGRPVIISGTLMDITEQRKTESQLLKAKQEAEKARHEAEEANVAKSRFLAIASHDLRQPLQANNLFVSALARTRLSNDQRTIIQNMTLATKTLSELLDALLDISRFDADVIVPQLAPVEVYSIFQRIDNEFAAQAMKKNLRFKIFLLAQPIIILTDHGLLTNILRNLVSNAIRYTDMGGVLIGARLRGNVLLIQVWDTGIGIKSEQLPYIYEEFYQADNPQRDRGRGLGLGLAIVRRMTGLLGYGLTCKSRYGRGSLFELAIPLDTGGLHYLPLHHEPSADARNNIEVLANRLCILIENDPIVISALQIWLDSHNIRTRCFSDSERALADPEITAADFFIVDYRIPGKINGLIFMNILQTRMKRPICGVILTGDAAHEQLDTFANAAWPVLHKPVSPNLLLETLARQWWEKHPEKPHEKKSR
ncbi:MAG: PAS domain-containing protein [Zoogloeaceae bacterium]|jgi:PAS domain S-box-containing protein|nr:PAS domain-containing protein [Zoogloeaceae bacterium]